MRYMVCQVGSRLPQLRSSAIMACGLFVGWAARYRRVATWLVFTIIFGYVGGYAGAAKSQAQDKWITLQTPNFNIVSNAGEAATRGVAIKLEQFQTVVTRLHNIRRASSAPITVLVFKDDASFKPFKPLYNGKPANLAGFFQRTDDENFIALNITGDQLHPLRVIFHEYTHLLLSSGSRPLPPWLDEGTAELYSTFELNHNKADIGRPVENHVSLLRQSHFMPFHDLFAVDRQSPAYNERKKQGIFYAESWALIHYLMFGDKSAHQAEFMEFLKLYDAGETVEKAFTAVFGADYTTLENSLQRYINGNFYSFVTLTLSSDVDSGPVGIHPLADADVQFYLGEALLHTNRPDDAVIYFKQAGTLNPASPRPYEGLGFVAMRHGDFSHAKEQFQQAVAHGSQNFLVHYYYAESLFRPKTTGDIDAETKKTIYDELKKSMELAPGFAQSYYLFGSLCYATGENLTQAIQAVKTAIKLDPQKQYFVLLLGRLQMRAGSDEAAIATLTPLFDDKDNTIRASARSLADEIKTRRTRGVAAVAAADSQTPLTPDSERPHIVHKQREAEESDDPPPMPPMQIPGTTAISGTLTSIECTGGKSVVLILTTDAGAKRFSVPDLTALQFVSTIATTESIGCGPMNRPVVIHFKPMAGQAKYAGQAVTVELK